MNSKTILTILLGLMLVGICSLLPGCAKEGPQGIPGPQGDSGVAGPAGADGSIIYSGTGVPGTSLGKNGDYYLDKSASNLYGPKTVAGWGTPLSLGGGQGTGGQGPQGPQGPAGAAGSQTYSGSGAPAATLGAIGDYYLDKTNFMLYGPKTANGWGTPILLRGAQGPQGPAGPSGVAGSQIFSGTGAPAANLGNIGDYYLDKSTVNFYGPKTANGWGTPISLNGGTGTQGPAGPQGPQGPQGPAGPQGPQGAAGATGAAGSQIFSGSGAPPAATGKAGDYFIDDTHAVLYGPKTATGWPATGLSLQVNNTITYNFVNKVQNNLPYNWQQTIFNAYLGFTDQIVLPYNNAGAQTLGFTIPQSIVDNGIVLAYIRYFLAPPSDTATDAGKTAWTQLPETFDFGSPQTGYSPLEIETSIGTAGYLIEIGDAIGSRGAVFAAANIPSDIRIVLIPPGQINTITSIQAGMLRGKGVKFKM